jgi:cytochrome P450
VQIVSARRANRDAERSSSASGDKASTTLLDLLLDARDGDVSDAASAGGSSSHLTDTEVVDQAVTFLLAGA